MFLRVGRYVEFYGPQRLLAERVLGLTRAYLPRAGYGFVAGFPVWLEARFAERALRRGLAVVRVASFDAVTLVWPGSLACSYRAPDRASLPVQASSGCIASTSSTGRCVARA